MTAAEHGSSEPVRTVNDHIHFHVEYVYFVGLFSYVEVSFDV